LLERLGLYDVEVSKAFEVLSGEDLLATDINV